MSWRMTRDVGERAGTPSSLKGYDKVEEGSGGNEALPAGHLDWRAVDGQRSCF